MERWRKRDVVGEIGRGRHLYAGWFQRWLRVLKGYPAQLDLFYSQTAGRVLAMLESIAIRRVMRTAGDSKIEAAEVERKHRHEQHANCSCGYHPSCFASITQGGPVPSKGQSCPSRVSGFVSANRRSQSTRFVSWCQAVVLVQRMGAAACWRTAKLLEFPVCVVGTRRSVYQTLLNFLKEAFLSGGLFYG